MSSFLQSPPKPTNLGELESICSTFASGRGPGYDNISICVIKHSFHLICAPLTNIINHSLQKGIFPDKLSINVQKTNYVIFSPNQRKVNHSFSLSFGGQPLPQSNVTKFLGVYLDEHLTRKYHINFVCKQIVKSVGILSRTRFYLSCKTKLRLYYTLV